MDIPLSVWNKMISVMNIQSTSYHHMFYIILKDLRLQSNYNLSNKDALIMYLCILLLCLVQGTNLNVSDN